MPIGLLRMSHFIYSILTIPSVSSLFMRILCLFIMVKYDMIGLTEVYAAVPVPVPDGYEFDGHLWVSTSHQSSQECVHQECLHQECLHQECVHCDHPLANEPVEFSFLLVVGRFLPSIMWDHSLA